MWFLKLNDAPEWPGVKNFGREANGGITGHAHAL